MKLQPEFPSLPAPCSASPWPLLLPTWEPPTLSLQVSSNLQLSTAGTAEHEVPSPVSAAKRRILHSQIKSNKTCIQHLTAALSESGQRHAKDLLDGFVAIRSQGGIPREKRAASLRQPGVLPLHSGFFWAQSLQGQPWVNPEQLAFWQVGGKKSADPA